MNIVHSHREFAIRAAGDVRPKTDADSSVARESPVDAGSGSEVVLATRALLALPDVAFTLVCLEGQLWLTRDGDLEDYVIAAGQRFDVVPGDKAVIHALQPSRIWINCACSAHAT